MNEGGTMESSCGSKLTDKQGEQLEVCVLSSDSRDFPPCYSTVCKGSAYSMPPVLTANSDVLGRLHFLVVSQGAFVFPPSLSADGSHSVGV